MSGEQTRPGFGSGIVALVHSAGFLARRPRAWPYALVPAAILVALASLLVALSVHFVQPAIADLMPAPSHWYWQMGRGFISWLVTILAGVLGLLLALAVTPPLSGPALEHLVELEERELAVSQRQPIGFLAEIWCGLKAQAAAAMFAGPLLVVLWIVDLLFPPASVVTVPLKLLITSLALAWNLFDYPLTLRGVPLRGRLALVVRNPGATLGFGAGCTILFLAPCFGVLMLPVGVVGATRLVWQLLEADPGLVPSLPRRADGVAPGAGGQR
jgi:CysZ protein